MQAKEWKGSEQLGNIQTIYNTAPPATGAVQVKTQIQTVKTADRSRLEPDAGEEKQL